MKYIKLLIGIVVIAAVLVGITYYFTRPDAKGSVEPTGSTIKQQTVEKDIKEKIIDASDSKFCSAAYDDILKRIDFFFKDEPSNLNIYTLKLQNAYTQKFVAQANFVFDRNTWSSNDIRTIRKELKRCQVFSPDDAGLASISNVLNDCDKLVEYNNKVKDACGQRPECISNSKYLYVDDDWDIIKTNELINSVFNVSSKAKNSPIYQQTRKDKVEERLKNAHRKFIEDKMKYAEKEAIGYNYNPARQTDYDTMGAKLQKNFTTYYNKWGDAQTVNNWQRQRSSWEKYIYQTQTNY